MSVGSLASNHRSSVIAGGAALVLVSIGVFFLLHVPSQPPPPPQPPPITMVTIKPPPPPPPVPQPKTIVQPKMVVPEPKPMTPATPAKPVANKAPAQTHMGTSIHSNGAPDSFNLSGTPGGNGMLDGGEGGGSRWGYYASIVQGQIQGALQKNPATRNATAGLMVRIWADADGLITRVELSKSSGDAALDDAVENQVLRHLQLSQPPPSDMPMPIVMRLTSEQPL